MGDPSVLVLKHRYLLGQCGDLSLSVRELASRRLLSQSLLLDFLLRFRELACSRFLRPI